MYTKDHKLIFQEIFLIIQCKNEEKNFDVKKFEGLKYFWENIESIEKDQIFLLKDEEIYDYGVENLIYLYCYLVVLAKKYYFIIIFREKN